MSEGRRLPQNASDPGRFIQSDLLILRKDKEVRKSGAFQNKNSTMGQEAGMLMLKGDFSLIELKKNFQNWKVDKHKLHSQQLLSMSHDNVRCLLWACPATALNVV